MSSLPKRIMLAVVGRGAMNVWFWALLIIPRIDTHAPTWVQLYSGILYLLVIALVYTNNLLLVPRLLVSRRRLAYCAVVFFNVLVTAVSYVLIVKSAMDSHPQTRIASYSIATSGGVPPAYQQLFWLNQLVNYFCFLAILVFIFTLAWYTRYYFTQQRRYEAIHRKQLETELLFLKGQLNPHFLFNTLNNLYGLSLENNIQTPDAILKLSEILRYLLYESDKPGIPFSREHEVMLAYIALERLRLHEQYDIKFDITSDNPNITIPPLLWLPVLENAFKYGTRSQGTNQQIRFSFKIGGETLRISSQNVTDSALLQKADDRSGIGLRNLKQRLEILYPSAYSISNVIENAIYSFELEIDLKTSKYARIDYR